MNGFPEVKKNFGFGCMRLKLTESGEVDLDNFTEMVDRFLAAGFNYFDTANPYIGGKSELAIRECLVKRYPRDAYVLANKLSAFSMENPDEVEPFFEHQLQACGVDYFDFYLLHANDDEMDRKFQRLGAYEKVQRFLAEGRIRHLCMSFHDTPEVLDRILSEHPEIEAVQIQFNYLDYESPEVQSRGVYEVCRKHGKPVIVMEPVKGGSLAMLNEAAGRVLTDLGGGSPASYAIRFCAGFEGIFMTLSGMSDVQQMDDNLSFMTDFVPLNETEHEAVHRVVEILHGLDLIPCTACRYCTEGCPQSINIPALFKRKNELAQFTQQEKLIRRRYANVIGRGGKAKDCIECGQCEMICPQHLPIRDLLKQVAAVFEA